MAKKKKVEEKVVIQKNELMPTTIGVLNEKENGAIFAFVWILVFVVGIIILPYAVNIINGEEIPIFSNNKKEEEKKEKEESPSKEIEYYDINENTSFLLEGFQFSKFVINETSFSFRIVNISGEENLFLNKNYYVEIYNKENMLLERFKIDNKEIKNFSDFEFTSNQMKNASKISVVLKEEKDYPHVSLNRDTNGFYILTCQKDTTTLSYLFEEREKEYTLKEIEEEKTIAATNENYEMLLKEYTENINTYNSIEGVKASLMPTSKGFNYTLSLNLKTIQVANKNRYFNDFIYYKKDTLAKVIAFELETKGYTCE